MELREMLAQIPTHWYPHMKLDFAKMSIRTILEKKNVKSADRLHKIGLENELNTVKNKLQCAQNENNQEDIDRCNKTLKEIELELDIYREKDSQILANRAKCKWYQEREKVTSTFLT